MIHKISIPIFLIFILAFSYLFQPQFYGIRSNCFNVLSKFHEVIFNFYKVLSKFFFKFYRSYMKFSKRNIRRQIDKILGWTIINKTKNKTKQKWRKKNIIPQKKIFTWATIDLVADSQREKQYWHPSTHLDPSLLYIDPKQLNIEIYILHVVLKTYHFIRNIDLSKEFWNYNKIYDQNSKNFSQFTIAFCSLLWTKCL